MLDPFDVLLINPPNPPSSSDIGTVFTSENLALGYLSASLLRHGARVQIIDCDLDELSAGDISVIVSQHTPLLVGITALARNAEDAINIATIIRQKTPDTAIVLGGLHFTYCGEQIMREVPNITYVIRGEGEVSIVALYHYLRYGKGNAHNIGGLIYRNAENELIKAPMQPAIEDLDTLPFPDRQVLRRALAKGIQPAIPMLGSRGCYGRCLFCNASKVYVEGGGRSWRHRSAKNIVDEMTTVVENYGEYADPVILFYDDTFIGPGKHARLHAKTLANEILARRLKVMFETFLRADSFFDDHALIAKLRKAGMVRTFMGIESSDDQELKLFRKAVTTQQVKEALNNLALNHVITPSSGFIMFLPYTTFDMLHRNANYLRKIGHASIWNLSTRLDVYGGNDFLPLLKKQGLITGSTLHGGLYTYKFKDNRVGEFSNFMDISQNNAIQRLDSSGRYIEFNHYNLAYEVAQISSENVLADSQEIPLVLKKIQDHAYQFFMINLEAFKKGAVAADLKEQRTDFLEIIDQLTDDLEEAYQIFVTVHRPKF